MVSIIILTYNSVKYIEKLLESIAKFNKDSDYEIIVVDNDSTDDTVRLIQKSTPIKSGSKVNPDQIGVKIIENEKNLGFSKGINIGAKEANGEYLLFINPDSEWNSGTVSDLVSIFEENPEAGVVGGKILGPSGIEKSAGKFLKTFEILLTSLSLDEVMGIRFSPDKTSEVDFVTGAFMAVRRDLFEKLSGFDENLFMYVEDMELCFRVKKAGMKVLFSPSVEISHESHGSSNRSFAVENIYRGLIYFHKKHGNALSYNAVKFLLMSKALSLVILGKIINNKYLVETYSKVLKI